MFKTNTWFSFSVPRENAEDEQMVLPRKTGDWTTATGSTISSSYLKHNEQMSEDELKRRPVEGNEKYERGEKTYMTKTYSSVKVSVQRNLGGCRH